VFPFWSRTIESANASIARAAQTPRFRSAVAALLVFVHVLAFAKAGHDRLGLPFNTIPEHAPYYSNPDAPAVGPWYPRQPHYWSRLIVSRWDSQHYIGFAIRGLTSCPTDPATATDNQYAFCGLVWFPAYGLVAGIISDLLHQPPDLVLMLMSCLAAFAINLLWTSRAITSRLGLREAWASLLAFNLFPTAFYVVTPYTEAATLALVLGGFVLLMADRWVLAGLAIGAATSLRANAFGFAVALVAAAAYAAWRRRRTHEPRWWRSLYAVPLAAWGLAVTLLAFKIMLGNSFAFLRAQDAYVAGQHGTVHDLVDPVYYVKGLTSQHMDFALLGSAAAIVVLGVREALRRLPREGAIFIAVASAMTIAIPLYVFASSGREYWSINRFQLLCPIIFLSAGIVARRHTAVFVLWLAVCAAFYWHVELCSYITQGRPDYCPCLGRMQFWAPFGS
jgi:hypothetical protein